MIQSLMVGLTEQDMQAFVNSLTLNDYLYPALFPLKQQYTLTWKALSITTGLRVMGDIVARGSSVDAKTRDAVEKIMGSIPKIVFKKEMDENKKEEYDIMLKMAQGDARKRALIDAWANDVQACWTGVAARLEWYALQQMSRGKVSITQDNNAGPVTEFDLDCGIPSDQKFGYVSGKSAAWTETATAKPVTIDMRNVVAKLRAKGINPLFAWMNSDEFSKFAATEEVIKLSSSMAANLLDIAYTPSLDAVNAALLKLPYLHGLQIKVVEQNIVNENKKGTRTPAIAFADTAVTFTESAQLGETLYKVPAEAAGIQGSSAYRAVSGHTMIKKYAIEEPILEVTMGIANAVPAWYGAKRSALFDSAHATFQIA